MGQLIPRCEVVKLPLWQRPLDAPARMDEARRQRELEKQREALAGRRAKEG